MYSCRTNPENLSALILGWLDHCKRFRCMPSWCCSLVLALAFLYGSAILTMVSNPSTYNRWYISRRWHHPSVTELEKTREFFNSNYSVSLPFYIFLFSHPCWAIYRCVLSCGTSQNCFQSSLLESTPCGLALCMNLWWTGRFTRNLCMIGLLCALQVVSQFQTWHWWSGAYASSLLTQRN